MNFSDKKVIVDSPARLHLGFYGINKDLDYSFGSIGLAINAFRTIVSAKYTRKSQSSLNKVKLHQINQILKKKNINKSYALEIIKSPPKHIGLGSGTQLSLCFIHAINILLNLNLSKDECIRLSSRGKRSGIGIGTFYSGGFIVDGCKKDRLYPKTLFNLKFPKQWHVILINDTSRRGSFGRKESEFFDNKKNTTEKINKELSFILMRGLFPSILYEDFDNFCDNLNLYQKMTSRFYKSNQKDTYLSNDIAKIIKFVTNSGFKGVGQSSWGPLSYIFTESKEEAEDVIKAMESKFKVYNNLNYQIVGVSNTGCKHKII